MLEIFILLSLSVMLTLGSLGVLAWLAATGGLATMDGLFLALVCLTLVIVFSLNLRWALRSQEFRNWIEQRSQKKVAVQEVETPSQKPVPEKQ